jgi:hypothetical protein
MADQREHDPWRRIRLPNGRSIEVLSFEASAEAEENLHVCGRCGSEYVHPVEWSEAGPSHWRVTLRCPECEWSGTGVFSQEAVERFDAELDRGTAVLSRELRRVAHDNLVERIDRFAEALHAGFVLPEDF